MSQDLTSKSKRVLLPILGEFRRLADGSYHVRPVMPEPDGDTWLTTRKAAELLGWARQSIHDYLGDLLVFRRPLRKKVVVSLRSVLKLRAALSEPDFWECQAKQGKVREWVCKEMEARRNV